MPKTKPVPLGDAIDETRATARLPGLDIEIRHRRSPDGEGEQLLINLHAMPSFDAVGSWLRLGNPFLFWAEATQQFWSAWMQASLPAPDARPALPKPDGDSDKPR